MDNPTHRPSFQNLFKGGIRRKLLGVIDGGGGLVAKSPPTLAAPWTVTCLVPLSMGFPRQEYWSGLPFPSPGDLPRPGIEPVSPSSYETLSAYMFHGQTHPIFSTIRSYERLKI